MAAAGQGSCFYFESSSQTLEGKVRTATSNKLMGQIRKRVSKMPKGRRKGDESLMGNLIMTKRI